MDKLEDLRLKRIAIVVFEYLLALLSQGSSLLFVTFDITLGKHFSLTRNCDFAIHK